MEITKEEELKDEAWLEQDPEEKVKEDSNIELPDLVGDKFLNEIENLFKDKGN